MKQAWLCASYCDSPNETIVHQTANCRKLLALTLKILEVIKGSRVSSHFHKLSG